MTEGGEGRNDKGGFIIYSERKKQGFILMNVYLKWLEDRIRLQMEPIMGRAVEDREPADQEGHTFIQAGRAYFIRTCRRAMKTAMRPVYIDASYFFTCYYYEWITGETQRAGSGNRVTERTSI